jgi:two-component system NtrC family response regulator
MEKINQKNILLIEDDKLFQDAVSNFLAKEYNLLIAESAEKALSILSSITPDLVLLDIVLPGMNGVEVLKKIKESWKDIPVIMLTAIQSIPKVVECIKLGAFDYLLKVMDADELMIKIEHALEVTEIKYELEQRRNLQIATNKEYKLIGTSSALKKIEEEIKKTATSDSAILIEGETGTGKELVARRIHSQSSRANKPFVAINCGAIPKDLIESEFFGHKKGAFTSAQTSEVGKFQLANGGTLLLDEIGELPLEAQTKLLRVLEEREFYPVGSNELVKVNVRIIASTNKNLKEMVNKNLFREDLFFRLNVYTISIPPLRERPEDIISLAEYFMNLFNIKFGKNFKEIAPSAEEILLNHSWKGNVRELRNLIEWVILSKEGTVIESEYFYLIKSQIKSSEVSITISDESLDSQLEELEKKIILQALERTKRNKTKAAKLLKLSLPAFYYRLEKHGLT